MIFLKKLLTTVDEHVRHDMAVAGLAGAAFKHGFSTKKWGRVEVR